MLASVCFQKTAVNDPRSRHIASYNNVANAWTLAGGGFAQFSVQPTPLLVNITYQGTDAQNMTLTQTTAPAAFKDRNGFQQPYTQSLSYQARTPCCVAPSHCIQRRREPFLPGIGR